MKNNNKEIRQRVVDQVLELMQQGINPWIQPWQNGNSLGNHNCISGHIYTGINIPVLTYSKNDNEFVSNQWITFNQTKKNDGKIIKGSKATKVIFIKKKYFEKKMRMETLFMMMMAIRKKSHFHYSGKLQFLILSKLKMFNCQKRKPKE